MSPLDAVIIAIVEGITEFLPISSTGHMIITEGILGLKNTDFTKTFIVNIQFGAILSVVVLYWRKFFQSLDFYIKLFIAFIPAAVIGFLLHDFIDDLFESVVVVAVTMLAGGIILLFVDRWFCNPSQDQSITGKKALIIGCFQCIAMIPGVSRSAAAMIGGMSQKLDRATAAEFSFFLAVPTMFAASAYKLIKNYQTITSETIGILLLGNAVAFVVAMLAIKSFIAYLTKHGFIVFGWYRIAIGLLLLILYASGCNLSIR
jgi:undecaprenyl-diphosphatase